IGAKRVNDVVNLKISRDGTIKNIAVTLTRNEMLTLPLVGRVKNAKLEDLKRLKAPNGIKIIELDAKYADYWKNNGVKVGAIITAINDTKINSVDDAQEALKNKSDYEPLRIELINSNGEKERYNFR
ncbi:MAG TPA: serine protease, partial [Mariniflexile sp.]|nr:serine protease [Mariniflexile sp.]